MLLLFCVPAGDDAFKHEIAGLGSITLPKGEWKLEESHTPEEGAHAFVFKKKGEIVERITIVRFENSRTRELTLEDSYGLCDMMGDSICEGLPSLWGKIRKRTGDQTKELGPGYFLRLPKKKDREPLKVTNIYPDHDGTNWMNHGVIASNKEFVFLFVHTSTQVLAPDVIEEVHLSSDLKSWPRQSSDEK